ncbi:MAG: hypothetical protein AAGJ70_14370 [Pseudomonadota bacterium]
MGRAPSRRTSRTRKTDDVEVTLDIAGMYFRRKVMVAETATVEDVMIAARDANTANDAEFSFDSEVIDGKTFLDGITVKHRNGSAKSGQDNRRVYPDGTYQYYDDSVTIDPVSGLFKPKDPNKLFVLAWQYYVYDKDGIDLSRFRSKPRKVVPFTTSDTDFEFKREFAPYTVVWRLIAIWLDSYGDSLKVSMSMDD